MSAHARLLARVAGVVAAGAVAVAVGAALLLGNTVSLRASADSTIRSNASLLQVVDLERLVVDAETGLRGYVITDRPLFLAPTRTAQSEFPATVTALQRAVTSEHADVPQAQALIAAARGYLAGYVPHVLAMFPHDIRGARSFAVTLAGKRLVDTIRGQVASLEHLISSRQATRLRAAHRSADHAVTEAVVVLVLLTVLTVLLGAFLGNLLLDRERARVRSERTTRTLQQSILPVALPSIPGCELAVRFDPARPTELVGGDFYDVHAVEPGCWAIVLGDVCGKGAEAAAVTAMARWTLRSVSATAVDPVDALRFLNEAMLRQDLDGRFITIAYLLLSLDDSEQAHVSIACAGHPAPILVSAAGEAAGVRAQGDLLGVWPEIHLNTAEVALSPGDGLVVYTDGVTDQGPGPLRSAESTLRDLPPGASAEQLADALERHAHELAGGHRDDIAILALRFLHSRQSDQPAAPSGWGLNLAGHR